MGKWADAFQAHIQARDTADTGDTSPGGPPAAFRGSVNSVSSVTATDEQTGGRQVPSSDLVSSVSAVSRLGGYKMQSAGCMSRARSRVPLRRSPRRCNAHQAGLVRRRCHRAAASVPAARGGDGGAMLMVGVAGNAIHQPTWPQIW